MAYGIVAIGASWGGLHAVSVLLAGLPAGFSAPVVVAQHRGHEGPAHLAPTLGGRTELRVVEASDKDPLEAGHVYVAPAGYHLLVGRGILSLSTDEPERFSRPSIDVLFESVAYAYRDEAVGVILTGASEDGAAGLATIRRNGGITVVQEPTTAERRTMPDAALAGSRPHRVLSLGAIPGFLLEVCGNGS
jgi:two-component system chemotaxis response regulator CheB